MLALELPLVRSLPDRLGETGVFPVIEADRPGFVMTIETRPEPPTHRFLDESRGVPSVNAKLLGDFSLAGILVRGPSDHVALL